MQTVEWPEASEIGPVTVLTGQDLGAHPHGNSVLVRGTRETVLIDPSLSVWERSGVPAQVDRIVLSHVHEDHIPGHAHFPEAPIHCHEADAVGLHSIEGLLDICGYPGPSRDAFREALRTEYHYAPRPDVLPFEDGAVFDLGGVHLEVIHLPGHTRGHCALRVPEAEAIFLGDIELSGFGPYYGDAWSDLEDFERTLAKCRDLEARHFITFHHKGTVTGREAFLEKLSAFEAMIGTREARLLEFLAAPRTLAECIAHRIVFRPHVEKAWLDDVERRTIEQHLARLTRRGTVEEVEAGRWQVR